jgi:hypothetical protein
VEAEWLELESPEELEVLLVLFGGFHDGCLREAHVWSETWVAEDLSMACPGHLDTNVRMLFQSQWRDPSAIELWFSEVVAFHLTPSPENYDSIIFDAILTKRDGVIFWADGGDWHPEHPQRDENTWIAARRLCWRDASAWMGDQLRYGPPDGTTTGLPR